MKRCRTCQTTESHRWHSNSLCTDCYHKRKPKICAICNIEKTSSRWYASDKGPKCPNCYNKERHEKKKYICIECGSTKSGSWYKGPICRKCKYKKVKINQWGTFKDTSLDIFEEKSIRGRYKSAISRLKQRNKKINWEITFENYTKIIKSGCYYCGKDLLDEVGTGLDRINNSCGYTKNNVLPCCGDCNKARGDRYSSKEFKVMRDALSSYRNNDKDKKVMRNELIMPFDVDRTLILYDNIFEYNPNYLEIMYGGRKLYFKPSLKHIDLLKHHKERGYHIRVWSANGFAWAEKVVKALNLSEFVDTIETKPKEYVDDKNITEWLTTRIFLEDE